MELQTLNPVTTYPRPARLTKLYADTKQSLQTASPPPTTDDAPEIVSLNRKYRIQKDRLLAWGLEWSDEVGNAEGDIDKSVERAGLTEVIASVMENIKGILEDVENLRKNPDQDPGGYETKIVLTTSTEAKHWTPSDKARYDDLVKDFTAAIDLLCDLSKFRRSVDADSKGKAQEAAEAEAESSTQRLPPTGPAPSSPAVQREQQSAFVQDQAMDYGSVPEVPYSMIVIPEEVPPPYDSSGMLPWGRMGAGNSPRVFGRLRRHPQHRTVGDVEADASLIPVMIEYASYDRNYKDSNVKPPLARLEHIFAALARLKAGSVKALAKLVGYFEDPHEPRFGLIFELPSFAHDMYSEYPQQMYVTEPVSLFTLLRNASRSQSVSGGSSSSAYVPPLEDRFRLALEVVTGFSYLQDCAFTHRNVSSNVVAVLPRSRTSTSPARSDLPYDVRRPILCAADLFSEFEVESTSYNIHQNIYLHPEDPRAKGITAVKDYDPRFDIYSLGLVMLEIGMWHPLADIHKEKYSLKDFRTRVEKIWVPKLVGKTGTTYMRCVQECLRAGRLESTSADASSLGQIYSRVKTKLERCCLIDEDDEDWDVTFPEKSAMKSTETLQRFESMAADDLENSAIVAEPETMTAQDAVEKAQKPKKHTPRYQFPSLELPTEILWQWNNAIEGRLARIVQKALADSKESCSIYLCYTGESEQAAKPTICVGCTSTKKVRSAIRRYLKYNPDIFDLAIIKGTITRSKQSRPRRSQGGSRSVPVRNPHHYQRPLCGASIGAWRGSEHSPAVSFGGVVMIEGKTYGMSVHHLLEDPDFEDDEEQEQPFRSSAGQPSAPSPPPRPQSPNASNDEPIIQLVEDDEDDDDEDVDEEEFVDDDLDEFSDYGSMADQVDKDVFEITDAGDTEGVGGGDAEEIIITQPALHDVADDFFPCEEDRDEDHIDSHALGYVHASSGLRRYTCDGVSHEIDWLLMKLHDERLQPYNLVAGGKRYCQGPAGGDVGGLFAYRPSLKDPVCRSHYAPAEDLYPRRIATSDQLSGRHVHSVGRTSGLGHGKISQTMHLVRFHGRRTFSRTWSVAGTFGAGGDSGAWVVDNESGSICGHVLAWSANLGVAYISPMDVTFDHIRRTLGVQRIELPGADDQLRPAVTPEEIEDVADMTGLVLDEDELERRKRNLLAKHMLHSGNPAHLEREWAARRAGLGQMASG